MRQIYTNTTEKVYLKVYKDGVLADADADPTYSLFVEGSTTAPRTGTSTRESLGTYSVLTDLSESQVEGRIVVDWTFTVATDAGSKRDYVTVVTPYASPVDIRALAPSGTSDTEIENAETFARYMINAYTGTHFGKKRMVLNLAGNDKNVLVLPYRIITLEQVDVDNEAVWTASPALNEFGRTLSITDTNYGIKAEPIDDIPSIYVEPTYPAWKKYGDYAITGIFGWDQVPDEVEYCARLLADDYFCKETAWKKRFVEQINASDWRIVFNQKQFQGTGNFFVDQILDDFKSIGMVII